MPPQGQRTHPPGATPTRSVPILRGSGLLGHAAAFRTDPYALMARFNRECGDVGVMHIFGMPLLVANSPELVGELLVEKASSFRKAPSLRAALHPLVGEGLFTSEGELWRSQRRAMAPMFHPSKIAGFGARMAEIARRCARSLPDGDVVDVTRLTTRIAMAIAGETLFGADMDGEADELGEALTVALHWAAESLTSFGFGLQVELGNVLGRVVHAVPGPAQGLVTRVSERLGRPIHWPGARSRQLQAAIAVVDLRVQRMIEARRAEPGAQKDLLARLLEVRDDRTGRGMSDVQLRDEIVTLFVAGHETTATALAWALYFLARDPSLHGAVEAEARSLERLPHTDDVSRLPLAGRVFKEALRICPPVPVYERQALERVEIGGHVLEAGGYAAVFPWAVHHRETLFPDADRFDPSRFEVREEEARPRHAYIPFGAGPRVCIGNHFALLEGPLVLTTLLQEVRFTRVSDAVVRPDPMAATMRPLGGVEMRVTRSGVARQA